MRKTIIIVDEKGTDRELLNQLFANEFNVLLFNDGKKAAIEIIKRARELAVVFLDWDTPQLNGYQVLQILKTKNIADTVPIILTTSKEDSQIDITGYSFNAVAVVRKPYSAMVVRKQVSMLLKQVERMDNLQNQLHNSEVLLKQQMDKLDVFYDNLLDALGVISDYRGLEVKNHSTRIKGITQAVADSYIELYPNADLPKERIPYIVRASVIRDIGKIAIPDSILLKPAKLTEDEREVMMSHTTKSCEMLEQLREVQDEEQYQTSYEVCRWHHERIDGSGYPDGLEGDAIPIAATIVAIADVYDALVSEKIYKKAYDAETAYEMIMKGECGSFPSKIYSCLKNAKPKIEKFLNSL